MNKNTVFSNIIKKIKPAGVEEKDVITKLRETAGIVKLVDAQPGYRKYLTKDGEFLTIQSNPINNSNIYSGTALSIEKSGGSGLCEGMLENLCGPILRRVREYEVRIGAYGDLGREKMGPHIEIFDTSIYKNGGKHYNRMDIIPLPRSAFEKYGIPSNFKIKPI